MKTDISNNGEKYSKVEAGSSSGATAGSSKEKDNTDETSIDKPQIVDWLETLQLTVTALIATLQHKRTQEENA